MTILLRMLSYLSAFEGTLQPVVGVVAKDIIAVDAGLLASRTLGHGERFSERRSDSNNTVLPGTIRNTACITLAFTPQAQQPCLELECGVDQSEIGRGV